MDLDALAALIGSAPEQPTEIDWGSVDDALGLRLPDDFRRFTEAYGSIDLGEFVWIWSPAGGEVPFEPVTHQAFRGRRDRNPVGYPYSFWPEPGGLLMWGRSRGSDHYFWDTSVSADPQRWPVVVHRYLSPASRSAGSVGGSWTGPAWHRIETSMTDVVAALVGGEGFMAGVHLARDPLPGQYGPDQRSPRPFPAAAIRRPAPASSPAVDRIIGRLNLTRAGAADFSGVDVPADYRALLDVTGPGTVGGRLRLLAPSAPTGFDMITEHDRAASQNKMPTAYAPAPGGIRLWGVFSTGETCWWLPAWYDAAGWPVLICAADGVGWQRLDITATDFVAEWLDGRMDLPVLAPQALPDAPPFLPAEVGTPETPPQPIRQRDPMALLATLLGPPDSSELSNSWTADERALNTRLPNDIKRLYAAYGSNPAHGITLNGPGVLSRNHEQIEFDVRQFFDGPIYPEPEGLLLIGNTEENTLWWHTTQPDPDKWNVVVLDVGKIRPHSGGLADFLVTAFTGRKPDIVRATPSTPTSRPT